MTRREILALVHATDRCTVVALAPVLGLETDVLLAELRGLAKLGIVRCEGEPTEHAVWAPLHPALDASTDALEALGEDPDMELTIVLPLRPPRRG